MEYNLILQGREKKENEMVTLKDSVRPCQLLDYNEEGEKVAINNRM